MIAETLYGILSAAAGITAITTGIYPSVIPQKQAAPAVVYQCTNSRFIHTFQEWRDGLVRSDYQIDCYAKSAATAETLAAAVVAVLGSYTTHPIKQVMLDNRMNLFEPDTEYHRVYLSFLVWHAET